MLWITLFKSLQCCISDIAPVFQSRCVLIWLSNFWSIISWILPVFQRTCFRIRSWMFWDDFGWYETGCNHFKRLLHRYVYGRLVFGILLRRFQGRKFYLDVESSSNRMGLRFVTYQDRFEPIKRLLERILPRSR